MNKKYMSNSQLKQFLGKKKSLGKPSIIYPLNSHQRIFVENDLGYITVPFIYRIYVRQLNYKDIRNQGGILMDVYRAKRADKSQIHCPLSHSEKKLLEAHHIYYEPFKYKIILNLSTQKSK